MNELELPTAPPLPGEVRERALRALLDGMDAASPRRAADRGRGRRRRGARGRRHRRGAAARVDIPRARGRLRTLAHGPRQHGPGATARRHGPAAPFGRGRAPDPPNDPDIQFPDSTGSNGTGESTARCEAAAIGSDRAAEYPPAGAYGEPGTTVFSVAPGTARVEVAAGRGARAACQLTGRLALCAYPGPGPLTSTLVDEGGNSRQYER